MNNDIDGALAVDHVDGMGGRITSVFQRKTASSLPSAIHFLIGSRPTFGEKIDPN